MPLTIKENVFTQGDPAPIGTRANDEAPPQAADAPAAARIRAAIAAVVREGRVRTYDMLRLPAGSMALTAGAAGTRAMTDAILARL